MTSLLRPASFGRFPMPAKKRVLAARHVAAMRPAPEGEEAASQRGCSVPACMEAPLLGPNEAQECQLALKIGCHIAMNGTRVIASWCYTWGILPVEPRNGLVVTLDR